MRNTWFSSCLCVLGDYDRPARGGLVPDGKPLQLPVIISWMMMPAGSSTALSDFTRVRGSGWCFAKVREIRDRELQMNAVSVACGKVRVISRWNHRWRRQRRRREAANAPPATRDFRFFLAFGRSRCESGRHRVRFVVGRNKLSRDYDNEYAV